MKYTEEKLKEAIANSISISGVMRELGYKCLRGGTFSWLSKKIKQLGLDTSHFLGRGTNCGKNHKGGPSKKTPEETFVISTFRKEKSRTLKRCMIEVGIAYECCSCKVQDKWMDSNLVLEIDHINSNPLDNRLENLRFLCPNCHSQTVGYNRNKNVLVSRSRIKQNVEVLELADSPVLETGVSNDVRVQVPSSTPNKKCENCDNQISKRSKEFCSQKCFNIANRKVQRPTIEELEKDLEMMSMVKVGEKYGVSDNSIRKWLKGCRKDKI